MKNALSNDYENLLLKHMIDMAHSVWGSICVLKELKRKKNFIKY